jgi:hypothetical protein
MGCGCGSNRRGPSTQTWQHIGEDGKVINTYSSEMDARLAASQLPGSRVSQS